MPRRGPPPASGGARRSSQGGRTGSLDVEVGDDAADYIAGKSKRGEKALIVDWLHASG